MRIIYTVFSLVLLAGQARPAPKIADGGVINAASQVAPGLPGYGIARGSLFLIKGTGFGDGSSVSVTVGGDKVAAAVVAAGETQITAVLPGGAATGNGTVAVTYNSETSNAAPIKVVDRAFGIFTSPGATAVTLPALSVTQSARPGQSLSIYGTGLGDGDIELWVAGKQAAVTGKGPSTGAGLDGVGFKYPPGTPGIDQIDFQVPEGPQGCRVTVLVRTGDLVSNFAVLPIMPEGGPCADANGFTPDEYAALLAGGAFKYGYISLGRSTLRMDLPPPIGSMVSTTESGDAAFASYEATELLTYVGTLSFSSIGSCTVIVMPLKEDQVPVPEIKSTPLDAGPALTVNGPKGSKQLTRQKDGSYSGELSSGGLPSIPGLPIPGVPGGGAADLYLEAGSYTVTGPGGADVGAFSAKVNVSTPITWTNRDEIAAVRRTGGVTLSWSGGNPQDDVRISGSSIDPAGSVVGVFMCMEKAGAGKFTVPPAVLLSLPASGEGALGGSLGLDNEASGRFTAEGIGLGMISASVSSTRTVAYQ